MNLDEMIPKKVNHGGVTEDDPTSITLVIQKFKELYDKKKALKFQLEETQKALDGWEEALIEKFTEDGVQNIKTDLGMFYLREDFFCSYDREREGETFSWLREHGEGDLIKETINARTLASWAKEAIDSGSPWVVDLPDFFKITKKPRIGVRGGK